MSEAPEPSTFLRRLDGVFDLISRICLIFAGTALVVMTLMFAWLVYGRYVLNDTPTWVEQVSHLLVMVIAFSVRRLVCVKILTCRSCCFAAQCHPGYGRCLFL